MKLLTEITERVEPLLTEENGQKSYYITGPFLQSEIKNRNGRIYPLEVLTREVNRYTKELIRENRALGELGHPDTPAINLDRVSHLIVELAPNGKDFMGKAKVMDTPNGRIVKSLIDEGVKLGVSSRGVGSLRSTSQGNVVGEDFYLATAADIVADPSAPNAFVRGIMEGKEWVWDNGILTEAQIAQYKKELQEAPKKQRTARKISEAKVWQKFLESISVSFNDVYNVWHHEIRDFYGKFRVITVQYMGGKFVVFIDNKKWGSYDSLMHAQEAGRDATNDPQVMRTW